MEVNREEAELKELLQKSTVAKTSNDFTFNVMQRIEAYEEKKVHSFSYFKISFVLLALAIVLSFFIINYISSISCRLLTANCELVPYIVVAVLAALILMQINFLVTRFNQFRHAIV